MYTERDFNKCLFNPCKKDLFVVYPRLMTIKNIKEKLIRYVIAVYDYNSPIVKEYRDLRIRKQQAAEFAGYNLSSDGDYLESLFSLKDNDALDCIDRFIKEFINSRLWARIMADEEFYWQTFKRMTKPIEDSTDGRDKANVDAFLSKGKLGEEMEKIELRIDAAYRKLYGDEDASKFVVKRATPEDMAATN